MDRTDFTYCNENLYELEEFGFKIHISATINNYKQVFDVVSELLEQEAYLKIIYMIAKGYYDTIFTLSDKGVVIIKRGIEILKDLEYVDGATYYENYFLNQFSCKEL